ncbi:MAG: hypothetical protein IJ515_03590 [Clostridia bacterium]|nr:hypothetical protein [Clostridia bacterium]
MSRWQYGDWAMAAVVIDDYGDVYPLSKLGERSAIKFTGYYEERGWLASQYYRMDDLAGRMGTRYEGSFDIYAHLRFTDANGGVKTVEELCEGYTCCGTDCYMLLIVTPGKDAASTTVEFQEVDESELKEAVGEARFNEWLNSESSKETVNLDGPLFN